jgi:hypothetical protein
VGGGEYWSPRGLRGHELRSFVVSAFGRPAHVRDSQELVKLLNHEGMVVGLRQPGDANRANRANVPVGAQVTDWHTRKPTP